MGIGHTGPHMSKGGNVHKATRGFMAGLEHKPKEDDHDENSALPLHVEKMAHGGYACMHCGGEVDEAGNVFNDDDSDDEPEQGENMDAQFAKAVKGGR